MSRSQKHLFIDMTLFVISVSFALVVVATGASNYIVDIFGDFKWLGIVVAGLFFTSVFTTAPAIVLLSTFAQSTDPILVALLGGIGAMSGDYFIFRFVRDRVAEDFKYLFSFSKKKRISVIFKTELFRFFVPLLGAFIIASPFPDELGVAMLGLSHVNSRVFLSLSFVLNSVGILVIAIVANVI